MSDIEVYKDPSDLRDIPLERLKLEGNKVGHQFTEWNNLFNVESAIRTKGALSPFDYHANPNQFTEIEKWSIYSNRFLILDREHLSDYKLFTKEEVLKMVRRSFNDGFQNGKYSKEEGIVQHEAESKYMMEQEKI